MDKLFTYTLAVAVCLGTTALLANSQRHLRDTQSADARLALDGAYRDGLYLGRSAAQRRQPFRPPAGRWGNEADRASFVAGYRRGYRDFLVSSKQSKPE